MAAFEWDPVKATNNIRKHGIQFADAVTALEEDQGITVRGDPTDEECWVMIGIDSVGIAGRAEICECSSSPRVDSSEDASSRETKLYSENL